MDVIFRRRRPGRDSTLLCRRSWNWVGGRRERGVGGHFNTNITVNFMDMNLDYWGREIVGEGRRRVRCVRRGTGCIQMACAGRERMVCHMIFLWKSRKVKSKQNKVDGET